MHTVVVMMVDEKEEEEEEEEEKILHRHCCNVVVIGTDDGNLWNSIKHRWFPAPKKCILLQKFNVVAINVHNLCWVHIREWMPLNTYNINNTYTVWFASGVLNDCWQIYELMYIFIKMKDENWVSLILNMIGYSTYLFWFFSILITIVFFYLEDFLKEI